MSEIREECGIFGMFSPKTENLAQSVYYGLFALQHRGQESCGIVVNDDGVFQSYKDVGLVETVFTPHAMASLGEGNMAIGHVRYGTTGNSGRINAQPMVVNHIKGRMALAHNGNLTNSFELREELELCGSIFHTSSDTEVISFIITKERLTAPSIEEAVRRAMNKLKGAYSLVIMSPSKLIAVRDIHGFRPICYGICEDGTYVVASESCALDAVGAAFIRDLEPGEIVIFDKNGVRTNTEHCGKVPKSMCVFEFIYFARPDSVIDGASVHAARLRAGAFLALEHPVQADVVIGAPDSGIDAAIGFSRQSGIPYGVGLIKNRYIGRTFISPGQKSREDKVKIKLNPISYTVKDKRVVLIDDSIVRGTTSARIVKILREAGAKEVHLRISAPPFLNPCYYGTDIDSREALIACNHSVEEIAGIIGVDTLGYLNIDNVTKLACGGKCTGFCTACFSGKLPDGGAEDCPEKPIRKEDFGKRGDKMKSCSDSYRKAGVDINAGYKAVELMKKHIARTLTAGALSPIGGFGGLFELDLTGIKKPVLVSGTDGVGTKLKIAFLTDRHDTVGIDCVAMCVNDIICCGAKPLFFLDYIAVGKNRPEKIESIVSGVSEGCVQSGCALIGGETAEMPGFYPEDEYDLAGFCVGVVDKDRIIDKENVKKGDVLIALPSSGVHSNGFSLVRKVFNVGKTNIEAPVDELGGKSIGALLLTPTKIYVKPMLSLFEKVAVKGVSHITGGGFYENIPRSIPEGLGARIEKSAVKVPSVFEHIAKTGDIPLREMYSTFNMGVGMTVIVDRNDADKAIETLNSAGEKAYVLGEIVSSGEGVILC